MSRKCQLTGKKANNAYAISHSHRRTKKLQEVNLQWKRVWWSQGNRWVKLRLSTKAIKTLEKNGLQAMAKQAGIDLNQYCLGKTQEVLLNFLESDRFSKVAGYDRVS
jgi:large subunit ribosomal protein L28